MKYKMICIDMDGTLLNSRKKISDLNKSVIKKAHDKGVEIVVTTGRLYNNAAYFSKLLGVNSPVIAANGAIVIEQKTNEIIYECAIPKKDCLNLLKVLIEYGCAFHFHTTDTIYCNNWFSRAATEIFMTKHQCNEELHVHYHTIKTHEQWRKVFEKEDGKIAKCIAFSFSKSKVKKIKRELNLLKNIVHFGSGNHSIEINLKDVSKGNAVKALIDKYNIKREEVICIGDNENDISMIEFAGLGVAMGNGIDKVKDIADYVTDTNQNDGVAKAIEKFVLSDE